MKPLSEGLKIVSPENVEFSKRSPVRSGDASQEPEGNPEQLMELLGDMDNLKVEIQERIRRMEAVKQAKSVLLEDAVRTEALSKKLAQFGKVMSGAQLGFLAGLEEGLELGPPRIPPREERGDVDALSMARATVESMALPWPKPDDIEKGDDETVPSRADSVSDAAAGERAVHFVAPAELDGRFAELSARISGAENSWQSQRDEFEQIASAVQGRLESIQQSVAEFERQEQTDRQELQALQEVVRQAIEALEDRIAHAEESLRRSEHAEIEARKLLEESTAQLHQALESGRESTAKILAAEASSKSAMESAAQRVHEAELFWKQRDNSTLDSKKQLDQATFALTQAHAKEESATADLISARQELMTAYQFAAVAAQRRLDASEFFRKAAFWAVLGTAFSWIGMVWTAWFSVRGWLPVWAPAAATLIIVALAVSFSKRRKQEAQGD